MAWLVNIYITEDPQEIAEDEPYPAENKRDGWPNIITKMRTASIKIDIVSTLKASIIAPSANAQVHAAHKLRKALQQHKKRA